MKELIKIQSELKAPKSQFNKFGNYAYRSAEDILEAVKPLLSANKCFLTVSDKVLLIGDRFYIEATAKVTNSEGLSVDVTALAREADVQKGMNDAQLTGSASSYARKYALNGLFAIDDNKDADSTNKHGMGDDEKPKANTRAKAVAPKVAPKPAPVANQEIPKEVRQKVADVTSREDVARIWTDYAYLRTNQEFNELIKQASALFPKEK